MRQVKRWRYCCDYCKKVSGSKHVMVKHEDGCTNNPERVCGYCRIIGNKQKPIEELKAALLLDAENHDKKNPDPYVCDEIKIINLRDVSNNCPACILAAIRQSAFLVAEFNFKEESAEFWKQVNIDKYERG